MQRRIPAPVDGVHDSAALLEEHPHAPLRRLLTRPVERSATVAVDGAHDGARLEQRAQRLGAVHRHRPVQRRVIRPVPGVDIGIGRDECTHARQRILADCPVKRRALLAIGGVDVRTVLEQVLEQRERVLAVVQVLGVLAAAVLHRQVHHRALRLVGHVHLGARVHECERRREVALGDRKPQRRLHRIVDRVELRALAQRELQHCLSTVESEPVQRSHVALVAGDERGTRMDEHLRRTESLGLARDQQWRAQLAVLFLQVSAGREKCRDAVGRVQLAREVQRRLLARARLVDVNRARGEQRAQPVDVALAQEAPDAWRRHDVISENKSGL